MLQRLPQNWLRTPPPHPHPQLLIEASDPALMVSDFSRFHDAGFVVALCTGPDARSDECPLLGGRPCQLLASSDVVLHHLDSHPGVAEAARRMSRPPRMLTISRDGDLSPAAPVDSQIRAVRHLLSGT